MTTSKARKELKEFSFHPSENFNWFGFDEEIKQQKMVVKHEAE